MSDTLIRAAQAEAARLEAELRATQTYKRLSAVKELIALYTAQTETDDAAAAPLPVVGKTGRATVRPGSQAASIITMTDTFLRKLGRRAQTSEILEHLQAHGTTFKSQSPIGSLSSALSHHALFDNKRGLGYGLSEWGGADVAPKSSGLFDGPGPPNFGPSRAVGHEHLETDIEIEAEIATPAKEEEAPAS